MDERARDLLRLLSAASRSESGCREFIAYRSLSDVREFFLYEVYTDKQSFDAHLKTEHYKRYAIEGAQSVFEDKTRRDYTDL